MLVTRCHMSHKTSNPCWALRRVGRRNLGAWPAQLNQSLSGAVPVVTAYVGPVPLRTCQPRAECWARTCAPAHTDSCRVAISRGGHLIHIGKFATAEEAALEYVRAIGPVEAAKAAQEAQVPVGQTGSIFHPGFVPPIVESPEEVLRQAAAEGLRLHRAATSVTGYKGVTRSNSSSKPFKAEISQGGKLHFLGAFATA